MAICTKKVKVVCWLICLGKNQELQFIGSILWSIFLYIGTNVPSDIFWCQAVFILAPCTGGALFTYHFQPSANKMKNDCHTQAGEDRFNECIGIFYPSGVYTLFLISQTISTDSNHFTNFLMCKTCLIDVLCSSLTVSVVCLKDSVARFCLNCWLVRKVFFPIVPGRCIFLLFLSPHKYSILDLPSIPHSCPTDYSCINTRSLLHWGNWAETDVVDG